MTSLPPCHVIAVLWVYRTLMCIKRVYSDCHEIGHCGRTGPGKIPDHFKFNGEQKSISVSCLYLLPFGRYERNPDCTPVFTTILRYLAKKKGVPPPKHANIFF